MTVLFWQGLFPLSVHVSVKFSFKEGDTTIVVDGRHLQICLDVLLLEGGGTRVGHVD